MHTDSPSLSIHKPKFHRLSRLCKAREPLLGCCTADCLSQLWSFVLTRFCHYPVCSPGQKNPLMLCASQGLHILHASSLIINPICSRCESTSELQWAPSFILNLYKARDYYDRLEIPNCEGDHAFFWHNSRTQYLYFLLVVCTLPWKSYLWMAHASATNYKSLTCGYCHRYASQ